MQLSTKEREDLEKKVRDWAQVNSLEDYKYGSPSRYWHSAFLESIITREEYDYMRVLMGDMFYYTGD